MSKSDDVTVENDKAVAVEAYKALFREYMQRDWSDIRHSLRMVKLPGMEFCVACESRDTDGALLGYSAPLNIAVTPMENSADMRVQLVPNFAIYPLVTDVPEVEIPAGFVITAYPINDELASQYADVYGRIFADESARAARGVGV